MNFSILTAPGHYALKPEFATQRQVEQHFAALKSGEQNQKLKEGLFDLISNVILFEVEKSGGEKFHFRFAMEDTSSFKNLDPQTQAKLKELYVDYFFRRQDDFWKREGLQKLPALKRATNMLICGEDLGMVPACVPEVMKELGLLSLEIQRMPKDLHRDFSRPQDAPYLSVVTPSHARHEHASAAGGRKTGTFTQKFFNDELRPAGRRAAALRTLGSTGHRPPASGFAGDVEHLSACRICWAWTEPAPRRTWMPSASTFRPTRKITGATACTCRWSNCCGRTASTTTCNSASAKTAANPDHTNMRCKHFRAGVMLPPNFPNDGFGSGI